jgi:hypothetical protein
MVISDPFDLLGIRDPDPDAATLAHAFPSAVERAGPLAARQAMDALRRPEDRAVATLLSPSMTPAAASARRAGTLAPSIDEAIGCVVDLLADALDAMERSLPERIDRETQVRRDPRAYSDAASGLVR